MKMNVGSWDRLLRALLGLVILGVGFYFNTMWGILGILPLVTAFLGYCPLYTLLHLRTAPPEIIDHIEDKK